MASSIQSAVSDGTLVTLDLSIDYLDRSEISVYFDSVPTFAWAWVGTVDKTIIFTPAVPNGVTVLVKRTTNITDLRHTFSLGAAFIAKTLDEDLKQVLHIAQEATERDFGPAQAVRDDLASADPGKGTDMITYMQDAVPVNLSGALDTMRAATLSASIDSSNALIAANAAQAAVAGKADYATLAGSGGSALLGFIQAGSGAVPRTTQAKDRERISLKDFGAVGDGVTDDTAAVQNFLNACAGTSGYVNPGVYAVTGVNILSNTNLYGDGYAVSRFLRKANAVNNNAILDATGRSGVRISSIGFDGNKANQTLGANTISVGTTDDITLMWCEVVNSKAVGGGFGSGMSVIAGNGQTSKRLSSIVFNYFYNNDGPDIFIRTSWHVLVQNNYLHNSGGGVYVQNFVFPPVAEVQNFIRVLDNEVHDQNGSGIWYLGYVESGTSSANARLGPAVPPQRYAHVCRNTVSNCTIYGIAFQGSNSVVMENNVYKCGSIAQGGGGILFNAASSIIAHNTTRDCTHYGIDAGGSYSCQMSTNNFLGNGATANTFCTDLNVGGGFNNTVQGNIFEQIGTHQMVAIAALGVEGDGVSRFPLPAGQGGAKSLHIIGNKIQLNNVATTIGVWVYGNQEVVTVQNNHVKNAVGINQAYILECTKLIASGNVDESSYANGSPVQSVTAASTTVIPDVGNVFLVGGNTSFNAIQSYSASQNAGKVRVCEATTHGSGYSRITPPTVTFSGGGGTGLAATALVSYNGELVGWDITNHGSGYTSAPTPSITHNGGSGGNCAPLIGCPNSDGREITLHFTGTLTVSNGGNITLNGNYSVTPGKILRLLGMFGSWYEIGRS